MTERQMLVIHWMLFTWVVISGLMIARPAYGKEPGILPVSEAMKPLTDGPAVIPIQEDPHFRDVCLLDSEFGIAVGDQGAIWTTLDGGETWQWQRTGFSYTLTDVCFLTRKIGWIAAQGLHPYGQEGWGLILHTRNGGATWEKLPQNQLPPLNAVQFFDLERGIAIGEASSRYPSGVLVTTDGGQTWTARPGTTDKHWLAAHFFSPEDGIVAGMHGQIARATADQFSPVSLNQFDLRSFKGISASRTGKCWLVGEGGSLLCSSNLGQTWSVPAGKLPDKVPLIQDLHTVAQVDTHVWVAGSPGSVIWHSPDDGQTWEPQYTGQSIPIEKLSFNNESHGCAVGALGSILLTRDGGRTWKNVRGENRHVALMQVAMSKEQIDIPLLAQQSAERGYRALTYLPIREDIPRSFYRGEASSQLQANTAVLTTHGSQAITAWQFPITSPDLEVDRSGLIQELNRWSDGNLDSVLIETLVGTLRTWRPEVIILPEASSGNEINILFQKAFHVAIKAAADPTQYLEQQETVGLKPWQVKRVFHQLDPGTGGDVQVDPFELLPYKANDHRVFSFRITTDRTWRSRIDPSHPIRLHS
ncbi:MAG: YCF48-related protein [Planctomycetaceae bacterium]